MVESRAGTYGETLLTGEEDGLIGFWSFDPYTAKYVRMQELVVSPTVQNFGYGTEITHLYKVSGVIEQHRLENSTLQTFTILTGYGVEKTALRLNIFSFESSSANTNILFEQTLRGDQISNLPQATCRWRMKDSHKI